MLSDWFPTLLELGWTLFVCAVLALLMALDAWLTRRKARRAKP